MAEHQRAQATTSSSRKVLWLAALDELEQEFLAFQKRDVGAASTVHEDFAGPHSARASQ